VVSGGASPLAVGTAGFAYSVGAAGFVTSRGASDGVHEFTNDGALSIACPTAPGSGLSRIDIVYVIHPAAGENGDTSSQPILGVSSGTAASSNPAVPTIPTGALELARNTMTSAATTTASAGNTIAQTAAVARLRGIDDTGWVLTGLSWSAGWAAAGVTAGWQTLAWRRIGNMVWINGVIFKSSAWSPNETMFSVPAALIPASNFMGTGDFVFDIQSGSGSVRNRGAGGSGATMGLDIRYVLG